MFGGWAEEDIPEDVRKIEVKKDVSEISGKGDVGAYVDFDTREGEEVLMQTAISLDDDISIQKQNENEQNIGHCIFSIDLHNICPVNGGKSGCTGHGW